jgi:hypothetical protein
VCFDRARGEGERQAELKKKKQKFLSSPAARLGEEGGGTVSLKTTLFCSFFFNMKQRRFIQNALFHLNKIWRQQINFQISPQFILCSFKSSNSILILRINSIASLPTSIVSPIVGHPFHFSHWF